ncbi:MAG: NAD(P)-dependent glycerol-1-phosphate dehydrogenase [Candidatus Bathyarchaeia archaeon]
MELPRKVIIGNDILNIVGEMSVETGLSGKAAVITGEHTGKIAGEKVLTSLTNSKFNVEYLQVERGSSVEEVEMKLQKFSPDILFAVGGGRIIDLAKYISARKRLKYVSIPTSAAHDGIASPQASINLKTQVSVKVNAPVAIIADIQVIKNSSFRLTASGCGDILAKFTAYRDWLLAHNIKGEYYGDYAANLALMSAKLIVKNVALIRKESDEGIRIIVEALISCGVAMSIAGSSRPCSGSEHLFSHALDAVAANRALHGEQCGVGTIMMAYLHRINWVKIRNVLKQIGAPTTAEELNVTPVQIVEALTKAHKIRPDRYTILGENGLSEHAAYKLAKVTNVIE